MKKFISEFKEFALKGNMIELAIGVIIGIVLCAKLITICLKKWQRGTYSVILGLIFGSFYAIFPRESTSIQIVDGIETTITEGADFSFNTTGIIAIVIGIVGILLPLSMEFIDRKKKSESK